MSNPNRKRKSESSTEKSSKKRKVPKKDEDSIMIDNGDDIEDDSQSLDDDYEEVFDIDVDELEQLEEDDMFEEDFGGLSNYLKREDWIRPALPKDFDSTKEKIVFQHVESDYNNVMARKFSKFGYKGRRYSENPNYNPTVPVVKFYGVTKEGYSVLCKVWGYLPYFYSKIPNNFNLNEPGLRQRLEDFKSFINRHLNRVNVKRFGNSNFVEKIEVHDKRSLYEYQQQQSKKVFKIYTGLPGYVPKIRKEFEMGIAGPGFSRQRLLTYESNVLFFLRSMIDYELTPCCWFEIKENKYEIERRNRISSCTLEINCSAEDLQCHSCDDEKWSGFAPLRVLSFDIECLGYYGSGGYKIEKGKKKKKKIVKKKKFEGKLHFAQADHPDCLVIQISNVVSILGTNEPVIKNVFVLDGCTSINDCEICSFSSEDQMLSAWSLFLRAVDPDIITGYNIINFDIPYLLDRANYLLEKKKKKGLINFSKLSRIKSVKSVYRNSRFSSKQMGTRGTKEITIRGRVLLDVLPVVIRDYKLSSYTLNNVSSHFLKEQKEDVHYSLINKLHYKDAESRKRLAIYCLKDSILPIKLIEKLMLIYNAIEMSRVTGVTLPLILQRGQQIKVLSQLLREARKKNFIMPTIPKNVKPNQSSFTGATVLKPKPGFYNTTPISTLDFASLYPSIMIAHNLCYSTLISRKKINTFKKKDYIRTPAGHCFIKKEIQLGLLPEILKNLLDARKKAKMDLKKKGLDPVKKAVLNARQLALKISANSVYGFTGASVGQLPCVEISSSVTAFGRKMIEETKEWVEKHYSIASGLSFDSEVIYGDTDSVMIKFGKISIAESIELGKKIGKKITKELFVEPIRLEFEKVYLPYLLLTKKHYAGLLYTNSKKYDKIDTKGIETVRRDKCGIVRHLVSTCLHIILVEKNIQKSVKYVKSVIQALLRNQFDISMLVISKTLALKEYKNKQPHSELAERLRKRNPTLAPKQGDRVNFVYIKKGTNSKDFEKSEDPQYVLKKGLPLDTQYYLEKKIKPSIKRLFELILSQKQMNNLFSGKHTRKIVNNTGASYGALMKYAKKKITCLGKSCRCETTQDEPICNNCLGEEAGIYEKIIFKRNHLEDLYSKAWSYCQNCQKALNKRVLCKNEDCPIFYMREQIKIQLKQSEKTLSRFKDVLDW